MEHGEGELEAIGPYEFGPSDPDKVGLEEIVVGPAD